MSWSNDCCTACCCETRVAARGCPGGDLHLDEGSVGVARRVRVGDGDQLVESAVEVAAGRRRCTRAPAIGRQGRRCGWVAGNSYSPCAFSVEGVCAGSGVRWRYHLPLAMKKEHGVPFSQAEMTDHRWFDVS